MAVFGFSTTGKEIVNAFPEQIRGRTFLFTGASEGSVAGQAVTDLAASKPEQIIFLARDASKVQSVVDGVKSVSPEIVTQIIPVELDDLSSVHRAAQKILDDAQVTKIDVAVYSAGIMTPPFALTRDGNESQFAVNHLSHFLLTKMLLPKIMTAGSSKRIVAVSSHGNVVSDVLEDPTFEQGKSYDAFRAYGQSKTANVLMTVTLNEKYGGDGLKAFAANPGSVPTNLRRFMTDETVKAGYALWEKMGYPPPQRKTLEQGCSTVLRAALDPEISAKESVFLDDCNLTNDEKIVAKYALDRANAKRVWDMSERLVSMEE